MQGHGMDNQNMEDRAFQYFSSINPMAKKIMDDQDKYRSSQGKRWESLTQEEKDDYIDEWFIDDRIRIRYEIRMGIVDTDNSGPECFPILRVRGGERIVHHIVESEEANSPGTTHFWKDEFSGPFSWETKSQMDMPFLAEIEEYDNMQLQPASESELLPNDSSIISPLLLNLQLNEMSSSSNSPQVSVHSLISNYEGDSKPVSLINLPNGSSRPLPLSSQKNQSSDRLLEDAPKRHKEKTKEVPKKQHKNKAPPSEAPARREEKSIQDIFQREGEGHPQDSVQMFEIAAKKSSGPLSLQLIDTNDTDSGTTGHGFDASELFSKFEMLPQNSGNNVQEFVAKGQSYQEKDQKREKPGKGQPQQMDGEKKEFVAKGQSYQDKNPKREKPAKVRPQKLDVENKAKKGTTSLPEAEVLLPRKQLETTHFLKEQPASSKVAKPPAAATTSPPIAPQAMTSSAANVRSNPILPPQEEDDDDIPKTGFEFLDNW